MRYAWALLLLVALPGLPLRGEEAGGSPSEALGPGTTAAIDQMALLGPPRGAKLEGQALSERTVALASRMRCPVCQGLSVADSPSSSAQAMLSQVRDLLAAGYGEQQILDYFEGAYGEFVLLEPKARGFNLVVWLTPILGLALGIWVLSRRLRSPRPGSEAGGETTSPELREYLERVRSEVGS